MVKYYFYAYLPDLDSKPWEYPDDKEIQLVTPDLRQAQRWETRYQLANYLTAIHTEPQDIEYLWISKQGGTLW